MLLDLSARIVISSLGWVNKGGLWTFDLRDERERTVTVSDAQYLSVHAGADDHFAVVHHHDGSRVEITVHRFHAVDEPVARAVVEADRTELTGEPSAWMNVSKHYTAYCKRPSWSDDALIRIEPERRRVEVQPFDWYDEQYDKGYQGIVDVAEIPGDTLLLVSIQRDSRLVLHDPVTRTRRGFVSLSGKGGNPQIFFRRTADELWATDYDRLVKVRPGSWKALSSSRLQPAAAGTAMFIGRFWFDSAETMCVVARPFSNDVVALHPSSLRTMSRCGMDGQPIEAVALPDGRVIARDWKTGALLRGVLGPEPKRPWFRWT